MTETLTEIEREAAIPFAGERAGQYLTFKLGEELYGLGILKVQEIIGVTSVTQMPRTPDFVRGVVNLRGKVIPVIDLRIKFGLEPREDTDRTCNIVVQVTRDGQEQTLGIVVDEVSEVVDVTVDQTEEPPSFGSSVDTEFILGMGKIGDDVVMLLDIQRALGGAGIAVSEDCVGMELD